jgi:polysaccharide biosynthesis protein PslH
MQWFLAEILPRIRAQRTAHLTLIGRSDGLQVPAALTEAVHCSGFVDDLRPLVQRAAVFVVPLRAGSGTRLKILEAMAMGKAIVSTRIGAEGIALVDGEHALLADTPDAFAEAVVRLQCDPALRRRLGTAARELVEHEYGWECIGQRMLALYRELLSSAASRRRTA